MNPKQEERKEKMLASPLRVTGKQGLINHPKRAVIKDKKLNGREVHQDKSNFHQVSQIQEPFQTQQR